MGDGGDSGDGPLLAEPAEFTAIDQIGAGVVILGADVDELVLLVIPDVKAECG